MAPNLMERVSSKRDAAISGFMANPSPTPVNGDWLISLESPKSVI